MEFEMLGTSEFFQDQIKQCRDFAGRATVKSDRDFWLKMAHRWEDLLQARQAGGIDATTHKFRFQRLRFAKRGRAA
jgi:hypothetical protein